MCILAIGCYAQAQQPVRWRTIVKRTSATGGEVVFRALIEPSWHLYGTELPEGGPVATSFDLSGSTGVRFDGAVSPSRAPLSVDDPLFGMTLTWWDANVEFKVPFTITGSPDKACIKAAIKYMTCDGNSCRPPRTESLSSRIPEFTRNSR